uniref:Uncharacterized protein n=1 Tax=Ascaris lumbricoides TaxID=6252 RepID=A0A0M3HKY5_ASCLU
MAMAVRRDAGMLSLRGPRRLECAPFDDDSASGY